MPLNLHSFSTKTQVLCLISIVAIPAWNAKQKAVSDSTEITNTNKSSTYTNYLGFGRSTASVGDVNHDGFDDVVVGANSYGGANGDAGLVYLFLGGANGLQANAARKLSPKGNNDFGISMSSAGDINNDGFSDVIIGSYGKVAIYLGHKSGLSQEPLELIHDNEIVGFGNRVAAAGDVNKDGIDDVLITASGDGKSGGKVFVYMGSDTGLLVNPATVIEGESDDMGGYFGESIASAGDVNHDGFADVIIGSTSANNFVGRAYIYLGSDAGLGDGLNAEPSVVLNGAGAMKYFGGAVATAGDVNHDGYSDVLVGAKGTDKIRGKAFLYLGGPEGLKDKPTVDFQSDEDDDRFGGAVSTAGDINKDGFSDIIIGARKATNADQKGRAYVYLGSAAGLRDSPANVLAGEEGGDGFGGTVSTAGDINHDGFSDIMIGAPGNRYLRNSLGGPETSVTGKVHVYKGGTKGLTSPPAKIVSGEKPPVY